MKSQKARLVIKESKYIKPGGHFEDHVMQPFHFMNGKMKPRSASDLPKASWSLVGMGWELISRYSLFGPFSFGYTTWFLKTDPCFNQSVTCPFFPLNIAI